MSETVKTTTEYRLKDTDPTVSFDINSVKSGEFVAFDYETFHELVDNLGGPKDNSQLNIHFAPDESATSTEGGHYIPHTHDATISESNRFRIGKALVHETAHYVDFEKSPPTDADYRDRKRNHRAWDKADRSENWTTALGFYIHQRRKQKAQQLNQTNPREYFAFAAEERLKPDIVSWHRDDQV